MASEVCRSRIETKMGMPSWVDDLRRRNPALAHELTAPEELIPHIGVADRATLKIAGETIELLHLGHGHCPGDLVVNFPERGILFAGDVLFAGVHGRLKTADVDALIAMLERLAEIACQTVIPGHGMPVKGIGGQAIETYKDYLIELRARIAELIGNGVPPTRSRPSWPDGSTTSGVGPSCFRCAPSMSTRTLPGACASAFTTRLRS